MREDTPLYRGHVHLKQGYSVYQVAGGLSWLLFPLLSTTSVVLSLFCIYRALAWNNDLSSWGYRLVVGSYSAWLWWDWSTPYSGRSRRSKHLVRLLRPLLDAAIAYFSPQLIADFDHDAVESQLANHPVAFCCHPHGILSLGILSNFGLTGGTLFFKKPVNVLTLNVQFYVPIWREFCIALGCSSVSRENVESMLQNKEDFLIVLGGARESLDAHPGCMTLTIRPRTGFFRLALKHQAAVFPTLTFGELDLYRQIRSPLLRHIQHRLLRLMSVALPLFYAKYWLIPEPRPLVTVVGKPVIVEQRIEHPSRDDVAALQERYIAALADLHKKHAHKYQTLHKCPLIVK